MFENVFTFHKYSDVTNMFMQLRLPTFDTVCHNANWSCSSCIALSSYRLVHLIADFCNVEFVFFLCSVV